MTSNLGRGGRRYAPYAFTEQGVAMLSSVLNSPRAIAINIEIMRAFVQVRSMAATHQDLAKQLAALQDKTESLAMSHDTFSRNTRVQLKQVFDTLRELMTPMEPPKKKPPETPTALAAGRGAGGFFYLRHRPRRWCCYRRCSQHTLPGIALFAGVYQISAAVLCVGRFVMAGGLGFFFAQADGFHLGILHTVNLEGLGHGFGTFLTQCEVVFASSLFVGVAFNLDRHSGMGSQELSMLFKEAHSFWLDQRFVEVEENTAFFVQHILGVKIGRHRCLGRHSARIGRFGCCSRRRSS